MESTQIIFPNQISEVLSSNNISQIQLKDGTIFQVNQIDNQNLKENQIELEEERHNHHKGGIGYFGQHFKTEYGKLCPDCSNFGGIVKKRKNYVLYVSKNCTEGDIALKHKIKKKEKEVEKIQGEIDEKIEEQIKENIEEQINEEIAEQINEQINEHIMENIEEQIQEEQNKEEKEDQLILQNEQQNDQQDKGGEGEIIMERHVEYNDVPIIDEKIILKKDDNICQECKNEELNNLEQEENICNECKEEQNLENEQNEENINNEIPAEENNINNVQDEMNDMEKENINEIGEENICDDCQAEKQNEENEEQKVTTTVQVLVPENQNEN